MGSLTNQYVSQSYQGLVKFENSTGVTGTLQYLEDGLGNDLPLQISNTEVKVTGSLYISDVQSNTGLTQALVVDTSTGQIFRNTITGGGGGSGSSGTSGTSGSSGTSGQNGSSGTSGSSGSSGTRGTSGTSGTSGSSGSSGSSGVSGSSGTSGVSGSSGTSGVSGSSGTSGVSGSSGSSGTSGIAGSSGTSGSSGVSGSSGTSGTSGQAGSSGTSGSSGVSGSSGTSGVNGSSGTSGVSGSSGTSGTSGISPSITVGDGVTTVNNVDNISFSGATVTDLGSGDIRVTITGGGGSGSSGTSGTSGQAGSSGTSGTSGDSGSSGTSGTSGNSGSSGTSGTSGLDGSSGTSGTSGTSGDSLFAQTGSWYNTTNNIGITGSLVVTGDITGSITNAQNAEDVLLYVKNVTGTQIDKGKVVRITGSTGDNALIALADWTDDNNSANTLGFVNDDIPNDSFGYVTTNGTFIGLNTSGMTAGDLLYLSSSGQFTNVIPPAPYHEVRLGQVLRVQQINGSAYVSVINGFELGELHDVDITSPVVNDMLIYRSGSYGQWVNETFAEIGLATTGSNNFVGTENITGSLNVSGSVSLTNSLKLYASASYANSAVQPGAYISESAPVSQSNVYMQGNPLAANQTGSIVVSGSNNIFLASNRVNTLVTQGTYGYIGGSQNIVQSVPTLTTSSVALPTMNGNTLQAGLSIGLTSSSLSVPNISNNNINNTVTLNHQSGSINFSANQVLGAVTSTQQVTPGKAQPTVGTNLFINSTTLNHISSSIAATNNILGGLTVTNQVSSSVTAASNGINATNNIVNGTSLGWWVSGSASTNQLRTLNSNLIVGVSNAVSASQVGSNNGHLVASAVVGQNLIISGSHASNVGGTAFFGRYNGINNGLDDSQNIVFAVGTGTGTSNRRTGFWIDSGSLTFVSGGLFVTGNVNVSQAVTASSFTGSFVGDGSGLTGIAGGNRNGLITTGSIGSTQTIAGKLQISGSGTEPLEILTAPNQLQINVLSGGPAFYRNSNDYNTVIGNVSGVQNGFVTGSEKNLLFTGFFMAFSSGSNNTVLSGNGSANFRSGSSNTIVGQIGNLEFGNANTYLGSANNPTLESDTLRIGAGNNEILVKSGSNALQVYSSVQVTGSINVSSDASVTGSLRVSTGATVTGSLVVSGSATVTGSLQGNVTTVVFASNTGSIDLNSGSFFDATGRNGTNMFTFANVKPGMRVQIKCNSAGGSTQYSFTGADVTSGVSLPITPSTGYNVVDIVSFGTTPTILGTYNKP